MTATECEREARIAEYGRRAALGLPLFGGGGGRLGERAACWCCGKNLKPSRWNGWAYRSRRLKYTAVEKETYCLSCFARHGWPPDRPAVLDAGDTGLLGRLLASLVCRNAAADEQPDGGASHERVRGGGAGPAR